MNKRNTAAFVLALLGAIFGLIGGILGRRAQTQSAVSNRL